MKTAKRKCSPSHRKEISAMRHKRYVEEVTQAIQHAVSLTTSQSNTVSRPAATNIVKRTNLFSRTIRNCTYTENVPTYSTPKASI